MSPRGPRSTRSCLVSRGPVGSHLASGGGNPGRTKGNHLPAQNKALRAATRLPLVPPGGASPGEHVGAPTAPGRGEGGRGSLGLSETPEESPPSTRPPPGERRLLPAWARKPGGGGAVRGAAGPPPQRRPPRRDGEEGPGESPPPGAAGKGTEQRRAPTAGTTTPMLPSQHLPGPGRGGRGAETPQGRGLSQGAGLEGSQVGRGPAGGDNQAHLAPLPHTPRPSSPPPTPPPPRQAAVLTWVGQQLTRAPSSPRRSRDRCEGAWPQPLGRAGPAQPNLLVGPKPGARKAPPSPWRPHVPRGRGYVSRGGVSKETLSWSPKPAAALRFDRPSAVQAGVGPSSPGPAAPGASAALTAGLGSPGVPPAPQTSVAPECCPPHVNYKSHNPPGGVAGGPWKRPRDPSSSEPPSTPRQEPLPPGNGNCAKKIPLRFCRPGSGAEADLEAGEQAGPQHPSLGRRALQRLAGLNFFAFFPLLLWI